MVPIISYIDLGLEEICREEQLKGNIDNNFEVGKKN